MSVISVVALLLGPRAAHARSHGIDSSELTDERGCNRCHAGGTAPTVALTASSSMPAAGEQITLTFEVTSNGMAQVAAGFNLRADKAGAFALGSGPNAELTRLIANMGTNASEATHMSPKDGVGSPVKTTFAVLWTPAAGVSGPVTFTAWGNSVNKSGNPSGDQAATTTLTVTWAAPCTPTTSYRDMDADGYGDPTMPATGCIMPPGYIAMSGDCNDGDASIHPGATEVCNGADDNCNMMTDEGLAQSTFYKDNDADGFGSMASGTKMACNLAQAGAGYVADNTDCNDAMVAVHPGAAEVCNGLDENCNMMNDEGLPLMSFFKDNDGDGFGSMASGMVMACNQAQAGAGFVADNSDCNDASVTIHPHAVEACNGADDDCNGMDDEGLPLMSFFKDNDGDGFGSMASGTKMACSLAQAGAGYVANNDDCNDAAGGVHPGVTEVCDGKDDDCDGVADDGLPASTFFHDADGDGHGNPGESKMACSLAAAGPGWAASNDDCNDGDGAAFPGAPEVCDNHKDDNCNGVIDSDAPANTTFYRDADGDGFGSAAGGSMMACAPPTGYVTSNTDCNDMDGAVHPGATEVCNGKDDDCEGGTDEDQAPISCGAPSCPTTVPSCVNGVPQTCTPVCMPDAHPLPDDAAALDAAPDTAPPAPTPDAAKADKGPSPDAGAGSKLDATADRGGMTASPEAGVPTTDGGAAATDARKDGATGDAKRDAASDGLAISTGGGGCDCHLAGAPAPRPLAPPLALALAAITLVLRRRRR